MILVHSSQIPDEYLNALSAKLRKTIFVPTPPSSAVYKSIASHPDIFIFQTSFKSCIYSKALSLETVTQLKQHNVDLVCSANVLGKKYPGTCSFNATRIGRFIIHNQKYTADEILDYALRNSLTIINTMQGYARCSTIPISDKAIMTEDADIFKNSKQNGLFSILVSKSSVILPGEKQGFLGGACGLTPGNELVFLGDITTHPDWKKIGQFAVQYGIKIIHLEGLPLYDAGSLMFFEV